MSKRGAGDNNEESPKPKVKDLKKAFENKSETLSTAQRKGPTAGTDTDMAIAKRIDEDKLRKTRAVFGAGVPKVDKQQEAVETEKNEADAFGLSVEEYRRQLKAEKERTKTEEETAKEFGLSKEEYRKQQDAMKKFKK